jgi:integrase
VARTCQCCAQGKDTARLEKKRRCCAVGECCKARLSSRTVNDIRACPRAAIWACPRAALSQAVTKDLIAKNMANSIKVPSVRKRKGKAWSSKEARQYLESARSERDPLHTVYVLILVLGLRKSEVLGLKWDDIDLDTGELTIGRQLKRVRKITVHDGRRTCATLLVDLDVHPRQVMQILRHTQIAVIMGIYARASSKTTRAALTWLRDSLSG